MLHSQATIIKYERTAFIVDLHTLILPDHNHYQQASFCCGRYIGPPLDCRARNVCSFLCIYVFTSYARSMSKFGSSASTVSYIYISILMYLPNPFHKYFFAQTCEEAMKTFSYVPGETVKIVVMEEATTFPLFFHGLSFK